MNTSTEQYTFGDCEHIALRMAPCFALSPDEQHFANADEEPDAIVQTLDRLCPGAPVAISALHSAGPTDRMEYKRFDGHAEAAAWVKQLPQTVKAVYAVMNPYMKTSTGAGITKGDISRLRWFLIDCDPVREKRSNATEWELGLARDIAAKIKAYLTSLGWPLPIEGDSGNGAHLLYAIDLPNDSASTTLLNNILKHLARFNTPGVEVDQSTGDACQLTKLYGTMARKGPATVERPHRLSTLTRVPTAINVVPLPSLLAACPATETAKPKSQGRGLYDLDAILAKLDVFSQAEKGDYTEYQVRCPWHKEHSDPDSRHGTIFTWSKDGAPGFKCPHSHCAGRRWEAFRDHLGLRPIGFPQTEAGDAECFAALYSDSVRYDFHRGCWLVSDTASGIWVRDPVEQLTQMVITMSRERQRQATTIEDVEKKKKAWAWAVKSEGRGHITNVLALARSVPPVADEGLNWDLDPFLLGVQNGVVDLCTGKFRKALPADRVTMRVRVGYDETATCPLWVATLAGIFAPTDLFTGEASRLLVDFMQRAIGYSITGDCREECCFFAWGEGGNGKGTLLNTLGWLFGDYTDDMPHSTLERSVYGGGIPNDVAKLEGKRFITCAEVNEFTLNEARLKALTGRDPMTARFLNREFFTFIPVGKIWIATNNKPKIDGTDDGIWRRIHLIPFTQKFEGGNINRELKDQLRQELPGILNWVIEGAGLWFREGLNAPESVRAATATYRHESNRIVPFVEACCITDDRLSMQAGPAFKTYVKFCNDTEVNPKQRLSDKAFHKAMRLMFKVSEGRQTFYLGVGLPADPSDTECEHAGF